MLLNTNRPFEILNRSGFDKQYEEYKQGMHLTLCVMNILQEKCKFQSEYSRALSGLSGRLREALEKTTGGTVHTAWLRVATALEMESQLHEKIAENLLDNLIQPLSDLIETFRKDKMPLKKIVDKETNNLFTLYEMEFHARHKLFTCFRNYERIYSNYHIQQSQKQQQNNSSDKHNKRSYSLNRSDISSMDSTSNSLSDQYSLEYYSSLRRNSIDDANISELCDSTTKISPNSTTNSFSSSRLSKFYTSLPHKKCTKSESLTLNDLKLNIRRHNSLSAEDTDGKKYLTINKMKTSYYTTLAHYYRACMLAEEARIDWHTRILKCLSDQQTLESQRLNGLANGLTVYRKTLDNVLPTWKAAINEVANAISLADPLSDLQNFRHRSHQQEDLPQFSSHQSMDSKNQPNECHIKKSKNAAHVGCSLQRLIDIPYENALLEQQRQQKVSSVSSKSRALNVIVRRRTKTATDKYSLSPTIPTSSVPSRLITQHYLIKWSILTLLDMLAKDVAKERRTKRGLSNLVQVYANQPAYTNMDTLMEARRRLYFSRVRLTYLLLCRQKLAHSLKQLHSLKTDNTEICNSLLLSNNLELPSDLIQAGFSKLILSSHSCSELTNRNTHSNDDKKYYLVTSRWIHLPDLDRLTNYGVNVMEWPPFPIQDIMHENTNDDIIQWNIEKIRVHLKNQPFSMLDYNNDMNDTSILNDLHVNFISNNIIIEKYNQPMSSIKQDLSYLDKSFTSTLINNSTLNDNNIMNMSYSEKKKSVNNNNEIFSSIVSQCSNEDIIVKKQSSKINYNLNTIEYCSNTISSKNSDKTVPLAVDEIDVEDSIVRIDSSKLLVPCSTSCLLSENTENSKENMPINSFWSRLSHSLRGLPNKQQSTRNQSNSSNTIESTRNNNDNSFRKVIVKSEISEPSNLRIVNIPNSSYSADLGSHDSSIDSGLSPSRKSVHFHTDVQITNYDCNVTSKNNSSDSNYEDWSSNLRCLGWAKVERNYLPQNSTEIHLQEGDIVSIYRKDNHDWWFGEVNGMRGRFPVSHVEEF
ncbi:hypothetical protein MN116_008602 [Schistosoma mekongi]|uniref:SH3 domain-containing protein n=1 Tax=Schistosoma mekongi TaxID=38744 RepID=A0AAE1Z6B5_SCHME|nr:hypothetical protein MN116_008602 [Schistosoma mekongi]